jgi:hypothetical protein
MVTTFDINLGPVSGHGLPVLSFSYSDSIPGSRTAMIILQCCLKAPFKISVLNNYRFVTVC